MTGIRDIAIALGGRSLDPFGLIPCPECQPARQPYPNMFALSRAIARPLARKGALTFPFATYLWRASRTRSKGATKW